MSIRMEPPKGYSKIPIFHIPFGRLLLHQEEEVLPKMDTIANKVNEGNAFVKENEKEVHYKTCQAETKCQRQKPQKVKRIVLPKISPRKTKMARNNDSVLRKCILSLSPTSKRVAEKPRVFPAPSPFKTKKYYNSKADQKPKRTHVHSMSQDKPVVVLMKDRGFMHSPILIRSILKAL